MNPVAPPEYAPIELAYAFCELFFTDGIAADDPDPIGVFAMMRRNPTIFSIPEAVAFAKDCAADPEVAPSMPTATRAAVIAQMDLPEFRTYLAAKLGMM